MKNHGPGSAKLRNVYIKFDGICQLCMKHCKFEDATRDHIIPRSKGGIGLQNNIQLAHYACNKMKGNFDAIPTLEERQANNRRKSLMSKVKREVEWMHSLSMGEEFTKFIKCPYHLCKHLRTEHDFYGCNLCECESWAT